ncbi:hypothetical protein GTR02_12910 [Kineococcus sp. R8]|uniref:HEAT repeat domain-containing protein n=1 Tax=Kineococcus siccus TaxID=2696567 RepID=UPI0014126944|nr:HEAT repeat domain-containing protein [Kineococcus siccus]NAZ82721.1 hypothetical protein [Kineococcus siccus]
MNGHPEHVPHVVPALARLLAATDDAEVLEAAVDALGHAWDARAAAVLLDLVPVAHPDARVRLSLAQALPGGVGEHDAGGDEDGIRDRVVEALVTLTADHEPAVRDWAAFGLGQLAADTLAVRDALAGMLADDHVDARCEALVALARTGDDRARAALLTRLDARGTLTTLELEAAAVLADPALHPALLLLAEDWAGDEDDFTALVATALARCAPDAGDRAGAAERAALEEVRHRVPGLARLELQGAYPRTRLVCAREDGDPPVSLGLWDDGEDPHADRGADVVAAVLGTLPPPR